MKEKSIDICTICRKPTSRPGSLTSWIFTSENCTCNSQESLSPKSGRARQGKRSNNTFGEKTEVTRQLDEDGFPLLGSRYKIVSFVGLGGMGEVYKANELGQARQVAIKVLRDEFARDTIAINRLKNEALTASSLNHPNILKVHGYSLTQAGIPYLVMEYVEGTSLERLIEKQGRFEWRHALNIILQICEGLAYAHERGIIHRDLKPSNILVSRNKNGLEHARILDLGISKQISMQGRKDSTKLTQPGEVIGSPLYMSPEQCKGEAVDSRSDNYALGCLTFELLTGEAAFAGENSVKVILNHVNVDRKELYAKLDEFNVPAVLSRVIIEGCLSVDPANRIASAGELSRQLWSIADQTNTQIFKASRTSLNYRSAALFCSTFALFLLALIGFQNVVSKKPDPAIRVDAQQKISKNKIASNSSSDKPIGGTPGRDHGFSARAEAPPKPKQLQQTSYSRRTPLREENAPPSSSKSAMSPKASEHSTSTARALSRQRVELAIKPVNSSGAGTPNSSSTSGNSASQEFKKVQNREEIGIVRQSAKRGAQTIAVEAVGGKEERDKSASKSSRLRLLAKFPKQWVRTNFDVLDRNRDNSITYTEAGYLWRWLAAYDTNRDGKVVTSDVPRTVPGIDRRGVPLAKWWIRGNFNTFDRNHDGFISEEEGPFLWTWMKKYDQNKDHYLSYPETYSSE